VNGQIIAGELYASPRPSIPHAVAATTLSNELGPPFGRGRGGPGGWVILFEPEVHVGKDVLIPDLAGWRRERMPTVPEGAFFTVAPDWVCEVLSPSTFRLDRIAKARVYARERVSHVWFIEPVEQALEIFRLDGETYRLVLTAAGEEKVRAEPFDAIELDLSILWAR
jgi:Uma2 family endonuclease